MPSAGRDGSQAVVAENQPTDQQSNGGANGPLELAAPSEAATMPNASIQTSVSQTSSPESVVPRQSPQTAGSPAASPSSISPAAQQTVTKAAAWVLQLGGTMKVQLDGSETPETVDRSTGVPQSSFAIVEGWLADRQETADPQWRGSWFFRVVSLHNCVNRLRICADGRHGLCARIG
jgi:hypothetical protein